MYEKYCELRDAKGVTDYKVAKATGIPRSTFSDWKSGRSKPKGTKLKTLAEYFNVPVGYFMENENKEENDIIFNADISRMKRFNAYIDEIIKVVEGMNKEGQEMVCNTVKAIAVGNPQYISEEKQKSSTSQTG